MDLQNEDLRGLYVVQKGMIKITYDIDALKNVNASSLMPEYEEDDSTPSNIWTVEKTEGSYFGEWTLLGEHVPQLHVVAVGDVECSILTKEKFDSVVGPLAKLSQDENKYVKYISSILIFTP